MAESKIQKIIDHFDIDETFTKAPRIPAKYKYTTVKSQIPPIQDANFMADLLHLPETKNGFKYLLVVIDLWSDEVDFEPLKNKESATTLDAIKKIFKRPYLKLPKKGSIATDAGTEFKDKFKKYLFQSNVYHKVALPNRHKQQSSIERANRTIGRILNGYMNKKEKETNEVYKEWTDIINSLRKLLNENPKKDQDPHTYKYRDNEIILQPSKYKVGDFVHNILEHPENALGHKQPTKQFREGDYRFSQIGKRILNVLPYGDQYRYILNTIPNVAYAEWELLPSPEKSDKYIIKQIIGKKKIKGKDHYLVWWKGYLKKNADWVSKKSLLEDDAKIYIDDYEKSV